MRYQLHVLIRRLDATVEEKESVQATRAETLYVIAKALRRDDFVSSFVFTVVADRS
jgi:hypothetical protein